MPFHRSTVLVLFVYVFKMIRNIQSVKLVKIIAHNCLRKTAPSQDHPMDVAAKTNLFSRNVLEIHTIMIGTAENHNPSVQTLGGHSEKHFYVVG